MNEQVFNLMFAMLENTCEKIRIGKKNLGQQIDKKNFSRKMGRENRSSR